MREAITQQTTWGNSPTAEYKVTAKKPKEIARQHRVKNHQPTTHEVKALTEDEKWVLESLYKRLPCF